MVSFSPPVPSSLSREKMPFHHVTAGLLYKGNYLNRSLSAGSDSEQLANISVEELDGKELGSSSRWNSGKKIQRPSVVQVMASLREMDLVA
jgi:hypothetical protein